MTDLNEAQGPNVPVPSKRKLTTATAAEDDEIDTAKKLRPETTPAAAVEEKIINGEKTETENDDEDSEEYEAEDEIDSDDAVSDGEGKENRNGKGKGIMKDDKGKGKMIEESDDDDDDDDSDDSDDGGATDSDGDDDLSDDPLAEVDLDNILPSRTRGRSVASSGVRISSNDDENDK